MIVNSLLFYLNPLITVQQIKKSNFYVLIVLQPVMKMIMQFLATQTLKLVIISILLIGKIKNHVKNLQLLEVELLMPRVSVAMVKDTVNHN